MNTTITTAEGLKDGAEGMRVSFKAEHPRYGGVEITGELVSVTTGTLGDDDPRLRVEVIRDNGNYDVRFVRPDLPVSVHYPAADAPEALAPIDRQMSPAEFAHALTGFSDKALATVYRSMKRDDSDTAGPWVRLAVENEVGERFCRALGI